MYKIAILSKFKFHPNANNYFKQLSFYNKPIERPIKRLKNIDIHSLVELPFYEQLDVIKTHQRFKGYAMSYKLEIIEEKIQLYN